MEINTITPLYPVKKPLKIIRDDNKQQSSNKEKSPQKKNKDEMGNEVVEQHIDEII